MVAFFAHYVAEGDRDEDGDGDAHSDAHPDYLFVDGLVGTAWKQSIFLNSV